jgi:hypothetical protein
MADDSITYNDTAIFYGLSHMEKLHLQKSWIFQPSILHVIFFTVVTDLI